MAFLKRIVVTELFGLYTHTINMRVDSPVTIVAGPNGIGKTTLLGMSRSLLRGDYGDVLRHEFRALSVEATSGLVITASPTLPLVDTSSGDPEAQDRRLHVKLTDRHGAVIGEEIVGDTEPDLTHLLPSWIQKRGSNFYVDIRDGERLDYDEVVDRFVSPRHSAAVERQRVPGWFDSSNWRVDFIETKRLDTLISRDTSIRGRDTPLSPIDVYLGNVRKSLDEARRESSLIRQQRDRTYVRRILNRAKDNVNEKALRARYERVEALADELRANGLLSEVLEAQEVLQSEKLTPTNKRIVNLFLDDFEAKLKPLINVSARLEQLREVIGERFLNKSMDVDPRYGVVFVSDPGNHPIAPNALSSGEQHALALMSRLLFSEEPGTTVMIDEPELSLHVSWQHAMVDDLADIAAVTNVRFVLATHSTAIINNQWELVEELGPIDDELARE